MGATRVPIGPAASRPRRGKGGHYSGTPPDDRQQDVRGVVRVVVVAIGSGFMPAVVVEQPVGDHRVAVANLNADANPFPEQVRSWPNLDVVAHDLSTWDRLHSVCGCHGRSAVLRSASTARWLAFSQPRVTIRDGGGMPPARWCMTNSFGCGTASCSEILMKNSVSAWPVST